DSHSHLVFAGDRTEEFNARMSGRPYSAGGIRTTVAATRAADDAELEANLTRYLAEALRQGTTTFETKSGYGLTVADESRALRLAARHTDEVTYLGAHIVAPGFADDPAAYVDLVTGEMPDACAPHARSIHGICEKGAFDGDHTRPVLTSRRTTGMNPRIHPDEVTCLRAHIGAPGFADDPAASVDLVAGEMLDARAPHARWIDVFCERGAFDGDQARAVLTAGRARGLHPRIHANQFSHGPG